MDSEIYGQELFAGRPGISPSKSSLTRLNHSKWMAGAKEATTTRTLFHDTNEIMSADVGASSVKRSLNVDSPSFTPTGLTVPGKGATISAQAASAAPFTPRGLDSGKDTPIRDEQN